MRPAMAARTTLVPEPRLGSECDFVQEVALWYPFRVIMMMIRGVPPEDQPFMRTAVQDYKLRDKTIKEGDGLCMVNWSGNRDGELLPRLKSMELNGAQRNTLANFVSGLKTLPVSYKMA